MGVYIPSMVVPKGCGDCPLAEGRVMMGELVLICRINGNEYSKSHGVCPLITVPPHGRLIDADAVRCEIDNKRPGRNYEDAWALTVIDNVPTVIPATERI